MIWKQKNGNFYCELPTNMGSGSGYSYGRFSMMIDSDSPFKCYFSVGGIIKKIGTEPTPELARKKCEKHFKSLIAKLIKINAVDGGRFHNYTGHKKLKLTY